jgi:hypothetical protein
LRHTFLTRLGESGCDAWTLMRVAGLEYRHLRAVTFIRPKMLFST